MPLALLLYALLVCVLTNPVLFASMPLALVFSPIDPSEDSKAFLPVFDIGALVDSAIFPVKDTFAMHHVIFPLSLEYSPIVPHIGALSFHPVLFELSIIGAAILPFKRTMPLLFATNIKSGVNGSISPKFRTFAVMLIFEPFTFVRCTINVEVRALAL